MSKVHDSRKWPLPACCACSLHVDHHLTHGSYGSYEALVEERSTLAFATKPVVGRKPQSRQPMVLRVLLGQGSLLGDPDVLHLFLKHGRALPIFESFGVYIYIYLIVQNQDLICLLSVVFTLVTDTTLWLGHSLASLRNSCSIIGEQQTRALQFRDEALPSAWSHFSSGLKWDLVEVRPVGRGGSNAVSSPGSTKKAGLTLNIFCMGQPGGIQLMPGCQDSALGLLSLQHFYWSTGREQEYMQWVVTVEMTLSGIAEFAVHSGTNISMPHFFLVCTLPPLLWVICGCAMECPSWLGQPFPHRPWPAGQVASGWTWFFLQWSRNPRYDWPWLGRFW